MAVMLHGRRLLIAATAAALLFGTAAVLARQQQRGAAPGGGLLDSTAVSASLRLRGDLPPPAPLSPVPVTALPPPAPMAGGLLDRTAASASLRQRGDLPLPASMSPLPASAPTPPAPVTTTSLDCDTVRAFAGADLAVRDGANFRALLAMCDDEGGFGARQLRYIEAAGFEGRVQAFAAASGGDGDGGGGGGGGGGRADGVIEEAFVGFVAGDGYAALMSVAVEACAENSQRPFVLFASGAVGEGAAAARLWPPERFPRLVVLAMPAAELHPWFDKLRAALLAPVRFAVIVEADSLATRHIDRLFHVLRREPDYGFPLMPVHMHLRHPDCEVRNGVGVTLVSLVPGDPRRRICGAPFATPLAQRTMRYGHAHIALTSAAKGIVAEIVAACGGGGGGGVGGVGGGGGGDGGGGGGGEFCAAE